ncbi:fucose 4-O-acetylase-like acetyltransferase [Microbacterium endophyticum]|uniref:Fucose 4-O-acetylase-like acetyltransferase n=1 Tax=Microbacterium endophyticum TaxID=1526412 RepID=A0A7W4V4A9_9MICO|nr:acyltransferase family protein [Microbacterium endophyticum]MBB2976040.1 fucose 4-O-acetylase-like acetyltransferase [Microbacterium endophyticum]NIK35041.1 fucose 4-O-acetylase-like acetyltransferase [Microbacterium endophyticum]
MTNISQPAPAREQKRRVPFWDNARFACIVLVVLGHALQRLTYDSDAALALYLVVYAFHMPAFAVISGYFSKAGQQSKRQMSRVITDILVPYVIFESLWTMTKWLVEGRANPNPTQPSWTLWFLLALGIFRLVLPYLALLKWPLLWTIGISIAAGYMSNIDSTLSLSRTLGLLPFFTVGWWLNEHDLVRKLGLLRHRQWWLTASSVAVFAIAGWATWTFADTWRAVNLREWLFYDDDYSSLGVTGWWAGGVRLALMAVALLLMTAFFVLIPRNTHRWTRYGQYTMYVYLLHSFVLYPFRESGVLRGLEPSWIWLPIVAVASVAIAVGLSSAPVRAIFRPIVEPRPKWLFADSAWSSPGGRDNDPTGSRRDTPATPRKERQ